MICNPDRLEGVEAFSYSREAADIEACSVTELILAQDGLHVGLRSFAFIRTSSVARRIRCLGLGVSDLFFLC